VRVDYAEQAGLTHENKLNAAKAANDNIPFEAMKIAA
jgi:hypothetical protein